MVYCTVITTIKTFLVKSIMDLKNKVINKDFPLPLYYQIKELLLEFIRESKEGDSIPTENELCLQFEVSRQTVRQAVKELVSEGYLHRLKGKGTFITEHKIKQDFLLVLDSFNNEMRRKGLVPTTKVLEFTLFKSDNQISKALGLKKGSDVVKLRRLRLANNEPFVLVLTYLPYHMLDNILSKNMNIESLYKVLERDYQLKIDSASLILESKIAGDYQSKHLRIKKGDPIQQIQRIARLSDGTPIDFSLAEYRGDRNKFTINLKKQHF